MTLPDMKVETSWKAVFQEAIVQSDLHSFPKVVGDAGDLANTSVVSLLISVVAANPPQFHNSNHPEAHGPSNCYILCYIFEVQNPS